MIKLSKAEKDHSNDKQLQVFGINDYILKRFDNQKRKYLKTKMAKIKLALGLEIRWDRIIKPVVYKGRSHRY